MGHVDAPTWTILVPTLGEREALLRRLLDSLLPQLEPAGGRVRVLAYWNYGLPRLPAIRQKLVESADTEYLSFVDDDDLVSDRYAELVLGALDRRPDYVGWLVQCYQKGRPTAISHHSIRYGGWWNEPTAYFRDLSHINPIRTELARLADFRAARPGQAEDRAWVTQLRETGRVREEFFIDQVMYHYHYEPRKSAWRRPGRIRRGFRRPRVDHPLFAWHPECPRAG